MKLIALSAAALLLASTSFAQAKTVEIFQQSSKVFRSSSGVEKAINGKVNFPDGSGGNIIRDVGFGFLYFAERDKGTTDPLSEFIGFCIELAVPLTTSASSGVDYETPAMPLGIERTQLLGTLFKNVYDESLGAVHQGAIAMTVWKLVHGDITPVTGDAFDLWAPSSDGLGTSYFDYSSNLGGGTLGGSVLTAQPAMAALSASWLEALDGDLSGDWVSSPSDLSGLQFYTSATSQDLVSYSPPEGVPPPSVPLPAGFWMLGAGLVLLGAKRKRA